MGKGSLIFIILRVKYQENQEELGLSGRHQLLLCTDDGVQDENINTIKKNRSSVRGS
jgi:hypothetical protein